MITNIFWDNDGILVDTEHLYFKATRDILAEVGVDLTRDLFIELLLKQAKGAWHLAAEKGVSQEEIDSLHKRRNEYYVELLKTEEIGIEGAGGVLKKLHGKIDMCIVTSSLKDSFAQIHKRTGFLEYIDFVLANGDYEFSKPHPAPYLKALEVSGKPAEECVVIEDSERGLKAAKAAGLTCWVIPTALTGDQDFSQADRILNSIDDVPELILNQS